MKTLRLKYRLEPIENNLYEFEILEMDESFRSNYGDVNQHYFASKQNMVKSDAYPNIYATDSSLDICLRGRVKSFDRFISITKLTPEQVQAIHQTLKDWSINWFKK